MLIVMITMLYVRNCELVSVVGGQTGKANAFVFQCHFFFFKSEC